MSFVLRPIAEWKLRTRMLELGRATVVMGVLNVTPDSFSDGGRFHGAQEAVTAALRMFEEGALIVDVGGESTRPGGYEKISSQEEVDRVLPVIERVLRVRPDALLSIDTYRAGTARIAVETGCEIVNDVSGFLWDPAMAEVCSELRAGVVLMHTRGRSEEWASLPPLRPEEVLPLVVNGLRGRLAVAKAAGVEGGRMVIDPGFGFGKILDENFVLLAHLDELLRLEVPILAGVSRKGFLGRHLPAIERDEATIAACTTAILNGASVIRVHNVRAGVEAARIADGVLARR